MLPGQTSQIYNMFSSRESAKKDPAVAEIDAFNTFLKEFRSFAPKTYWKLKIINQRHIIFKMYDSLSLISKIFDRYADLIFFGWEKKLNLIGDAPESWKKKMISNFYTLTLMFHKIFSPGGFNLGQMPLLSCTLLVKVAGLFSSYENLTKN